MPPPGLESTARQRKGGRSQQQQEQQQQMHSNDDDRKGKPNHRPKPYRRKSVYYTGVVVFVVVIGTAMMILFTRTIKKTTKTTTQILETDRSDAVTTPVPSLVRIRPRTQAAAPQLFVPIPILLNSTSKTSVELPEEDALLHVDDDSINHEEPDYGGLQVVVVDKNTKKERPDVVASTRKILVSWDELEESSPYFDPKPLIVQDDDFNPVTTHDEDTDEKCQPTMVQQNNHRPICNRFQELGVIDAVRDNQISFLGQGDMNNVFAVDQRKASYSNDLFIFKGLLPFFRDKVMDERRWNELQREAMVTAAISHHPRIVTSFGFCGFVVLGELMKHGKLDDLTITHDTYCEAGNPPLDVEAALASQTILDISHFSETQKLRFSLDVAESLAVLHNHPEGAMVHGDLWLGQLMVEYESPAGPGGFHIKSNHPKQLARVKLNDFNNAAILEYQPATRSYCPFNYQRPWTDWEAAPEDVQPSPSGTERDVFRLGNILYNILTGLEIMSHVCGHRPKLSYLMQKDGQSFLDPRFATRTKGEGVIYDIIQDCWKRNPADRPEIGTIVKKLSQAWGRHQHELSETKQKFLFF